MTSWKLFFIWIGGLFLGQLVGNSIFLPIEFLLNKFNLLNTGFGVVTILAHILTIIIVCSLFLERGFYIDKEIRHDVERKIEARIREEKELWERENKKAQTIAGPKMETIKDW